MEDHVWTIYLCFWLAVFGAVLGSFLDCAASRWAAGAPPFRGRSRCSSCGHALGAGDLIPVFSFLRRRGRCRIVWLDTGGRSFSFDIRNRHPLKEANIFFFRGIFGNWFFCKGIWL